MTTTIYSNGSKWHDQAPDDLSTLLNVLERHPLEGCSAPFVSAHPVTPGRITFHGNFRTVAPVFRIQTDNAETIANLSTAIILNLLRPGYERVAAPRPGT